MDIIDEPSRKSQAALLMEDKRARAAVRETLEAANYKVREYPEAAIVPDELEQIRKEAAVIVMQIEKVASGFNEHLLDFEKRHPDTRIVVITGAADVRELELFAQSGVEDYLLKPFDVNELARRVGQILGKAPRGGKSDSDGTESDPYSEVNMKDLLKQLLDFAAFNFEPEKPVKELPPIPTSTDIVPLREQVRRFIAFEF